MKFLKKKEGNKKFSSFKNNENKKESNKEALRGYKCNKTGHIKVDCPFFQNKKKNPHHKQVMKAIWSNNSNFSSIDDKEHVVNICFMAIERENEVISSNDESDLFYNELHDAFKTLYDEYKKLGSKYSILKKNHACLLVKKDTL
jgi:agmatine/peptidylarginine deiminase